MKRQRRAFRSGEIGNSCCCRRGGSLGPLTAGLLLSVVSAGATIAVFVAWSGGLLLWAMLSPAIRAAPSLDELEGAEVAV
jgi:hypothetical protein